jgi:hypothetical protein
VECAKAAPAGWAGAARLGAALVLVAGLSMCAVAFVAAPASYVGWDREVLVENVGRWLSTGTPYPAHQLAGPFTAGDPADVVWVRTMLYPPPAVLLFLPFAFVPAVLWWVVPLGIVAWSVYSYRPRPWAVALIGLALLYPGTWTLLVWGNATMIFAALLALGLRWPAFAPWVLCKPTLAPFALPGIHRRQWWVGLAVLGAVSLAMLPLWPEWWTSTQNLTNDRLTYSLYQLPMMCVPLVAYLASRHHAEPAVEVPGVRAAGHPQHLDRSGGAVDGSGDQVVGRA